MESNTSIAPGLQSQPSAIIHFIQRMDIEMVNDILTDGRTYQDKDKSVFIHKLGIAFEKFIENGDTFLDCYKGFCNVKDCNFNCSGYSFIGNHTHNYLDMVFIIQDEMVHDLYECGGFKISQPGIEKKERIYIDKFEWIKPF